MILERVSQLTSMLSGSQSMHRYMRLSINWPEGYVCTRGGLSCV